jgi:hypothetical protein
VTAASILGLLIVVGVAVALLPMDAEIRRWVVIIAVILAVVCILRLLGLF